MEFLGRLLKLDRLESIERVEPSLAAPWAQQFAGWLLPALLVLAAGTLFFYMRLQSRARPGLRLALAIGRALLLCLLLLFLAEPILVVRIVHAPRPWFWVLFDGTDSMAIEDDYSDADRQKLNAATAFVPEPRKADEQAAAVKSRSERSSAAESAPRPSRQDYVAALLKKQDGNVLRQLSQRYRLKAFQFERPDGASELPTRAAGDDAIDPAEWADRLSTNGNVTALGQALEDLASRQSSGQLAGLLVVSDFDQNSGPPAATAARKLGVPVYTLGVGAESAVDLAVDLEAPLLLKKSERTTLTATLRSNGLNGSSIAVKLTARPVSDGGMAGTDGEPIAIDERSVRIELAEQRVEFNWTPAETGRFVVTAACEPQEGELVTQNNRAEREVNIRDDFLRLMFVEYEPTWEWRFIKEVFHRDKLVGQRGFRTFLRSADPNVRRTNELFLSTLTPKRSDFFANDVIFLGDMPASALTPRYCEMTREFVNKFGGGLVVVSGPRFGPGQLAGTALADMLPVIVDPGGKPRDERSFALHLTEMADAYDFMQLGADERESTLAWSNLNALPWYQPVSRLHPQGEALAVHPSDKCVDGMKPQPIIAYRKYGRGQVIYIGCNETWRLRRKYGELYYRQFWGQMIHRLGLSHALGSQKRFVVRTDRQKYQPDDKVVVTVEAYNANYEPLSADDVLNHALTAELTAPGGTSGGKRTQSFQVPQFREGVFETRLNAVVPGEHRISVKDPVTDERSEVYFQVADVSVERRSAVRNTLLAREIAHSTGGESYDLTNVSELLKDFQPQPRTDTSVRIITLWDKWLTFGVVLVLMLGEWLLRKLANLP
jgi:hypothetical protein